MIFEVWMRRSVKKQGGAAGYCSSSISILWFRTASVSQWCLCSGLQTSHLPNLPAVPVLHFVQATGSFYPSGHLLGLLALSLAEHVAFRFDQPRRARGQPASWLVTTSTAMSRHGACVCSIKKGPL